jgi:alanine racemase
MSFVVMEVETMNIIHRGYPDYARDTIIEIDLDALTHNITEFQRHLPVQTKIMMAVKANAYGHGSIPIAKAALQVGVFYLGVAFVDEGVELRLGGIEAPILVLGYTPHEAIGYALKNRLSLTIYSLASLQAVEQAAAELGVRANIHIKVDTGMGRIGVQPAAALPLLQTALKCKHIRVEGLFTHFATTDERDQTYARWQGERFARLIQQCEEEGMEIPLIHGLNSGGAMGMPEFSYDMVRLGISLYGSYPARQMEQAQVRLKPVLTFKSKIVHLKQLPAGIGVSYGKTYISGGKEWIATLPVGYADGYSRSLSQRGYVLVAGIRVPIIGRISMDQLMLDVTEAMPVRVGDEVVLYGRQGDEQITLEEVADQIGTIHYEVTCMLNHRVPRVYMKNGQIVEIANRLRYTATGAEFVSGS